MKRVLTLAMAFAAILCAVSCRQTSIPYGKTITLDQKTLADKIKGGWFAQTIGCTYGGPTEFKFKGGLMPDEMPIIWYTDYIYDTFIEDPGLYDDVYMDLTFLEVMSEAGIDAPVELFADRFANAPYKLWHANQTARYNILNGIPAPASGHWKNNPHADDIDFQIEADFIGMLTPGMPNTAAVISDRIGHIMNYGDGWYGGVFTAAMYSLAYVCDDIETVVREALETIPVGTKFRDCIEEVLLYWQLNPNDWKKCWFEVDQRHSYDIGCPEGVFNGFNIDARINAAYVVMGLLYGKGDFEKTMDIATRCGQDSDCNPASAAGILGVMYGYDAIPDKFKAGIARIADMPFPYTTLSLNTACEKNLTLLHQVVEAAPGGALEEGNVTVKIERPVPVRFEQSFEGLKPVSKTVLKKRLTKDILLTFVGNSIVVEGSVIQTGHDNSDYRARVSAYIDDKLVSQFTMPFNYIVRKGDVFATYGLESGKHTLRLVLENPHRDYAINIQDMVVYDKK